MYKLPCFTEHDPAVVLQFMHAHPFVTLIGHDGHQSVATQIPVLIVESEGRLLLQGHVMRNTDHHKALLQDPNVLVLFQGPHCYVSSSWYTQKTGATWNYQTVHVRGTATLLGNDETVDILTRLTARFEVGQPSPLLVGDMPHGYVQSLVGAIAGIEIAVTDIYPIFKLSQNRDDESYQNIVRHLRLAADPGANQIADEMVLGRPQLFQ